MNFLVNKRAALAGVMLAAVSATVSAQDAASFCKLPGQLLLEDAAGDGGVLGLVPLDSLDLLSLHVAQPTQEDGVSRIVFTLKTSALTVLPPQAAWFTSFQAGGGNPRGVRMQTDNQGNASFVSYLVATDTNGNTTGSLVDSSKPAEPESNFNADGTITIVVKASDIGLREGAGTLKDFNAGSVATFGDPNVGSVASQADGMPDDLSRSGSVEGTGNAPCESAAKAGVERFGGALNFALLLPLMLLGLRRR